MAIEMSARRSRRSLLTAAGAAVVGAVAASVSGAQRALAAGDDGSAIHVGDGFTDVQGLTWLENTTNDTDVFLAYNTHGGVGVQGQSHSASGVLGNSGTGEGLRGKSTSGVGVYGSSLQGIGVLGSAAGGGQPSVKGVKGASDGHGVAVQGEISDSTSSYTAVYGVTSGSGVGVAGEGTAGGAGTYGLARGSGDGVYGESALGRGGRFKGKKAQLRLQPAKAAIHPFVGARGDFFVDKSGRLWFCKGGSVWAKLA